MSSSAWKEDVAGVLTTEPDSSQAVLRRGLLLFESASHMRYRQKTISCLLIFQPDQTPKEGQSVQYSLLV